MNNIICPYCHDPAVWCENKEIYGRNYGKSYMCWFCKKCRAYVGCHNNTEKPLGTMANKQLRQLRMQCHKEFDKLWKGRGRRERGRAYEWIRYKMNLTEEEAHIGMFDEAQCSRLLLFLAGDK